VIAVQAISSEKVRFIGALLFSAPPNALSSIVKASVDLPR
jgi:hypothetical protein